MGGGRRGEGDADRRDRAEPHDQRDEDVENRRRRIAARLKIAALVKADGDPGGEVGRGQFHLLFPNVKLNVMPGRPNLSIGPIHPEGPDRSTVYLDYFFGEDVDDRWIEELLAFDNQVGVEDQSLVESVHRGMRSGAVDRGRLLLSSEGLIHEFQRYVLERLA